MLITLLVLRAITFLFEEPRIFLFIAAVLMLSSFVHFFDVIGMAIFKSELMLMIPAAYFGFCFLLSSKTRQAIVETLENYKDEYFYTLFVIVPVLLIALSCYSTNLLFEEFSYVFSAFNIPSALVFLPLTLVLFLLIWVPFYLSMLFSYLHFFKTDMLNPDA